MIRGLNRAKLPTTAILLLLAVVLPSGSVQAQPFVYITQESANIMSVIDATTNTVCATIPTSQGPQGVAAAPDGTHVYVANLPNQSNSVSVIDTVPGSCQPSGMEPDIFDGGHPIGLSVTPDGTRVYVAEFGADNVTVIDTSSNMVVARVSPSAGPSLSGIAITPDGTRVYVPYGLFDSTVAVIDTNSNTVLTGIPVGVFSTSVAITPNGTRAYVTNGSSNNVSVIDTDPNSPTYNTVLLNITLPPNSNPWGVAITPDGNFGYVADMDAANVAVIDTNLNSIVTTIPVGVSPTFLAITPDGNSVYVATSNGVSVIDTASQSVVFIPMAGRPWGVAISPF